MNNKIGSILMMLTAFAAISFVSTVIVTGQDPPKPVRAIKNVQRGPSMVTGTIRWSKTYGFIPMGPGNSQAAVNPCGAFYVAATVPSTGKAIKTTAEMTLGASNGYYYRPDYYVCSYKLTGLPTSTPLYIIAGLGGSLLLPQIDDSPMYLTDGWIGGSYNKPPNGTFRTFTGSQSVNLSPAKPSAVVNFELVYARKDNPK